ncbi:hypothetical protein CDL12_05535 [Handroanthus impetiginosus]|uniref:Uncharacterized protein n=1 Tax=Handroanthus impetiginosus TaxID=429701 RepID=A0A2G9HW75_9LAMI|nr:hypothetical protein CDL12_05535 [Handroanthus impetiginosus]
MRCFTACFATWKHKEIKINVQEQSLSPSFEAVEVVKLLADTTESLKEDEVVSTISESEAKTQEQIKCSNKNAETDIDKLRTNINDGNENEKREEEKDDKECLDMNSNEIIDNKECLAMNSKERTSDDDAKWVSLGDCFPVLEESSESLFSLSIDSRKQVYAAEMGDKEVSSNPSKPIETEQKSSFKYDDEDKENVNTDQPQLKPKNNEIVCDTSLSSWLVESEKSFQKESVNGNSPESEKNYGERRVLGAINGGSMLGCSGDDQPSIGTVGRYWLAGGMSTVSTKV